LFFAKAGEDTANAPIIAAQRTRPKDVFIFKSHIVTMSFNKAVQRTLPVRRTLAFAAVSGLASEIR
jgi:hypothetical protein